MNAGFYIVLIVIFFVIQLICGDVGKYLSSNGDQMNLFEMYIWFMSSRGSQLIYLLGIIFIVCGCAFFGNGAAYNLMRMKRKTWIASHITYMGGIVAIYNICFLLFLWVPCRGALTIKSIWSDAAHVAGQMGIESIGIQPVMGVNYKLLSFNPNLVGILTFVISMFLGMFVGMVLLAFMLYGKFAWGVALIGLLWFADVLLVERFSMSVFHRVFPFSLSRVSQMGFCSIGPPVPYAIAYFLLASFVLVVVLEKISTRIDFVKME